MALIRDEILERDFIQTVLSHSEENPGRLNAELAQLNVSKESFTGKWFWEIYDFTRNYAQSGNRLDESTLASSVGKEARDTIASCWPVVPKFGSIRVLGQKLSEYRSRRAASSIGRAIISAAENPDDGFSGGLLRAAAALQASYAPDGTGIENGENILVRFFEQLEESQTGGGTGVVGTGIRTMDEELGGIPRKFLSIIGAYPGCFKSGILATIAANVASSGRKVGFFSLEDSPTWLSKRYVSRHTGIPIQDLARRKLSKSEQQLLADRQDDVLAIVKNIYVDGRSNLRGADVAASARFMVATYGCDLLLIDHIGEVVASGTRKDRHDLDVADNVRLIRDVAKDTGCAILMAAHLRRKHESEEDIHRVPSMTDFSDSSSIEKMCRLALGLWQPPESPDQVAIKVLKQNEGGSRGRVFHLNKDPGSALVKND